MKWIKIQDELPIDHDGFGFVDCLIVVGNNPQVREAMFNTRSQRFMTRQYGDLSDAVITHWCKLPDLPNDR